MNVIDDLIRMDTSEPKRILVIGDVMTDVYIYGTLSECQEGCVKLIKATSVPVPGGAANAARCLLHWKSLARVIGDREKAPVKMRFMSGNSCTFRYDDERNTQNMEALRDTYMMTLASEKWNAVLLSDYDKGLLTPDFIRGIIRIAKKQGAVVVADAKREPELYAGAIIKGNAWWFHKYKPLMTTPNLIITNGNDLPTISGRMIYQRPRDVPCINHVGAGDCFAVHMILALAYKFSLKDAVTVAYSAGRVYVQRRHNAPPRPEEIRDDMIEGKNVRV